MYIHTNNLTIYYEKYGNKENIILILPGWGNTRETFRHIINYFKEKFNIEEIHGGIRQKGIVLGEIMERNNLKPNEILYIGDDINDIPAMELVKYRIAPKNVNPVLSFKVNNLQITEAYGGDGAIREIADTLVSLE